MMLKKSVYARFLIADDDLPPSLANPVIRAKRMTAYRETSYAIGGWWAPITSRIFGGTAAVWELSPDSKRSRWMGWVDTFTLTRDLRGRISWTATLKETP